MLAAAAARQPPAALESAARGSAESRLVIGEFRRVRQGRAVDNGMERVSAVLARMGGDPAAARANEPQVCFVGRIGAATGVAR